MNKVTVKTAIIPHNNDLLTIRKYQDSIKGIPAYPLYFLLNEKIPYEYVEAVKVINSSYISDRKIILDATVICNGSEHTASLELISKSEQKELPPLPALNLKVFQTAQIQFTQNGSALTWEILSSKWIDSRK